MVQLIKALPAYGIGNPLGRVIEFSIKKQF